MAAIGSRTGSQGLREVCHRLVDVVLWQLFPDGLRSDFQLINRLGLRLEFMVLFQHGAPDVIVQWAQIWRVWGSLILFNERRAVRLQPILPACRVSWSVDLLEDEAYEQETLAICDQFRQQTTNTVVGVDFGLLFHD